MAKRKDANPERQFTREQLAEDTDRKMRGLPQIHGAVPEDEEAPEPEKEGAEPEPEVPEGESQDEEQAEAEQHQELCQRMDDLNSKLDRILDHLGLNKEEKPAAGEEEHDLGEGFGG